MTDQAYLRCMFCVFMLTVMLLGLVAVFAS